MERSKDLIRKHLSNLLYQRLRKEELKENLICIFGKWIKNLDDHYIDGCTYSDMEIYDDFYSFEIHQKDVTILSNIFFLKTNEPDIIFITEFTLDFVKND